MSDLNFDDVIRAGGGEPPPRLTPRQRYPADSLETETLRLIAMRCWFYSDGCLKEYDTARMTETFMHYLNACLKTQWDINQNWYEEALHERTNCDRCGERYMLENLSICTDCLNLYCFKYAPDFPKAKNGNPAHGCELPGSSGGELVG